MNRILYTLLIAVLAAAPLAAQITLTADDAPPIGTVLTYHTDTLSTGVNPGPPGSNLRWNFASLLANDTFSVRILPVTEGPDADKFPEANIALEIDSIFFYSLQNADGIFNLGAAVDLFGTGEPLLARFEPRQQFFRFPTSAGDNYNQTYRLLVQIDGSDFGFDSVRLTRRAIEMTTVDAWGTLTTPADTYDALRLHITSQYNDTIYVKTASFWLPISTDAATSDEYRWVAKGGVGNVMSIFLDEDGRVTSVDWLASAGEIAAPLAAFSVSDEGNGAFAFTDQSTNSPSIWSWDFGDGAASTERNPTHTYANSGMYTVCLTASNIAGANTACQTVNAVVSSTAALARDYGFRLYPNPAREYLLLDLRDTPPQSPFITIFNPLGQLVWRQPLTGGQRVDTGAWPAGSYRFAVRTAGGKLLGSGVIQVVK